MEGRKTYKKIFSLQGKPSPVITANAVRGLADIPDPQACSLGTGPAAVAALAVLSAFPALTALQVCLLIL